MKKLILVALACWGAYYLYTTYDQPAGIYTEDGAPVTLLFTSPDCGAPCKDMRSRLKRHIDFDELNMIDQGEGERLYREYGGNGWVPYIAMGRQRIIGPDSNGELLSAIAIEYGPDKLSRSAQRALARNFNPSGEPVVVMYATESCGYCRKAERYFRERGIAYLERDIEKDPSARRDFETLVGTGTPLLFHGYERMVGFDERKVKRKLRL